MKLCEPNDKDVEILTKLNTRTPFIPGLMTYGAAYAASLAGSDLLSSVNSENATGLWNMLMDSLMKEELADKFQMSDNFVMFGTVGLLHLLFYNKVNDFVRNIASQTKGFWRDQSTEEDVADMSIAGWMEFSKDKGFAYCRDSISARIESVLDRIGCAHMASSDQGFTTIIARYSDLSAAISQLEDPFAPEKSKDYLIVCPRNVGKLACDSPPSILYCSSQGFYAAVWHDPELLVEDIAVYNAQGNYVTSFHYDQKNAPPLHEYPSFDYMKPLPFSNLKRKMVDQLDSIESEIEEMLNHTDVPKGNRRRLVASNGAGVVSARGFKGRVLDNKYGAALVTPFGDKYHYRHGFRDKKAENAIRENNQTLKF